MKEQLASLKEENEQLQQELRQILREQKRSRAQKIPTVPLFITRLTQLAVRRILTLAVLLDMEEQDMAQTDMVLSLVSLGCTADFVMIILAMEEIIVMAAVPIPAEIAVGDWMSHAERWFMYELPNW